MFLYYSITDLSIQDLKKPLVRKVRRTEETSDDNYLYIFGYSNCIEICLFLYEFVNENEIKHDVINTILNW